MIAPTNKIARTHFRQFADKPPSLSSRERIRFEARTSAVSALATFPQRRSSADVPLPAPITIGSHRAPFEIEIVGVELGDTFKSNAVENGQVSVLEFYQPLAPKLLQGPVDVNHR